jgi:hypothetical protein
VSSFSVGGFWNNKKLTTKKKGKKMDPYVTKFINMAQLFEDISIKIRSLGVDDDYDKTPLGKASESQLVVVLRAIESTLAFLPRLLSDASYALAWKRAGDSKKEEILFREFKL